MLEMKKRIPLYQKIINDYCEKIMCGYYKPNDKLPSLIQMSREQGIDPNTFQTAFQHLDRLGITYIVKARGRYVSANAIKVISDIYFFKLQTIVKNLALCGVTQEEIYDYVNKTFPKD